MEQTEREHAKRAYAKLKDYKEIFESEQGLRVLCDMMSAHSMMSTTFNPDSSLETAFKEGERNVILRIFAMLKVNPYELKQKIEEADKHARKSSDIYGQ